MVLMKIQYREQITPRDCATCFICGNELSLSEMKSVLLKKGDHTGFVHITCATSDDLIMCIIEIAGYGEVTIDVRYPKRTKERQKIR